MSDNLSRWEFSVNVSTERKRTLAESSSFDALVAQVVVDISEIRARIEPGRDPGLEHCLQPIFSFELQRTGDRLFNGRHGYRAQYWHSPSRGLAANATLLVALTPKLLATVDATAEPRFGALDVCASLRAASAKLWIQEIPSLLVSPAEDLEVQPWLTEARRGVQLARWGICAPEVTRFEVKGALMDSYGNEVVPSRKTGRHYDIHYFGFS